MVRHKTVNLRYVAELCRKAGGCSEAEIAYWFNISPYYARMVFKQLRDLCRKKYLNTPTHVCYDFGNHIEFRPSKEVEEAAAKEAQEEGEE